MSEKKKQLTEDELDAKLAAKAKAEHAIRDAAAPAGIPVAILRFVKPSPAPGYAVTPDVRSETAKDRRRWEVTFIPQMRHHRVAYWKVGAKEPAVRFFHETQVASWDPA